LQLAVITPFLDRRHGTERVLLEQIRRLVRDHGWEIHLYAQRADDLGPAGRADPSAGKMGSIVWHKVPAVPGPHLLQYVWWFFANRICRWIDARFRGLSCDLLYSPGINALDADAIAVHIVFHEFARQVRPHLRFSAVPVANWPRLLHRRLYYRLIMALERRIYRDPRTSLSAVSGLVAAQLAEHFDRRDVSVIPNAVDLDRFATVIRRDRRAAAREQFFVTPGTFLCLLIGNDWRNKGLDAFLHALAECRDLPVQLLIVGSDDPSAFLSLVNQLGLSSRVQFRAPSDDVLQFYAAADAYVGPSLEDAYGLPILEAMACGLPVIASVRAGVSEIIRDDVDGLLLRNPENSGELARLLRRMATDASLRERLSAAAELTARGYTWDRCASLIWKFLEEAFRKKNHRPSV